ncbi:MAG TPA: VOC family protein [Novosphingobium sp.]|nr:VOC family protein [Novosphingobium sp.]
MPDKLLARFGFPKLVVRDLDREIEFYRAVMGYGEGQFITGQIAGRPIREIMWFGDSNNVEMLILEYVDGKGPPPEPSGVISGIFTPDLDAFQARVLAAGGTVFQPIGPIELPSGTSRFGFYADPEGYLMEVIEG